MSVVRGRPPGLAGGMNGSSSRYWSSLSAWPDPKSPTSTRSSSVHIEASQPESPPRTPSPQSPSPRQADQHTLSKQAFSPRNRRSIRPQTANGGFLQHLSFREEHTP